MKQSAERLFRAIGYVGDDLIARADKPVTSSPAAPGAWRRWAALAACCALVIGMAAYALPHLGLGAKSGATESAMEYAVTTEAAPRMEAAAEQKVESAEAESAEAPTEEAAEECAPAESEAALDTSVAGGKAEDGALAQALLTMSVGPVKLGMMADSVYELLGAPLDGEIDFSDAVEIGGIQYASWKYNLSGDPDYICDVSLSMADAGDGFVVDAIMTFGASPWETEHGIHNGSSAEDVASAYPDAQAEYDASGALSRYVLREGHTELSFRVENGTVRNISLGTFYEEPAWEETMQDEMAYSFAASEIFVYADTPEGRTISRLSGEQAKRVETILGIEELQPLETLPAAAYYLDFGNQTVVMLGQDRLSGAVYTCEDLEAFREVMNAGEDPAYLLTLVTCCVFPDGTQDVIEALIG